MSQGEEVQGLKVVHVQVLEVMIACSGSNTEEKELGAVT